MIYCFSQPSQKREVEWVLLRVAARETTRFSFPRRKSTLVRLSSKQWKAFDTRAKAGRVLLSVINRKVCTRGVYVDLAVPLLRAHTDRPPIERMSANTVCLCGGEFSTQVLLVQHANHHGHMIRCSCHRLFATSQHLRDHEQDTHPHHTGSFEVLALINTTTSSKPPTGHTCTVCHTTLANERGLAMHKQAKHPSCPVCLQNFPTAMQLEGHQQATAHCYCAEHSLAFISNGQLRNHLQASLHVTGFECTTCERSFRSNRALSDHLGSEGHSNVARAFQARVRATGRSSSSRAQSGPATQEEEATLRCHPCDRTFMHITGLYQHKRSVKHHPLSDLRCPFSKDCTQAFTSPSALLFHLEAGTCKSGMNRAKVNSLVHQHDSDRHITSAANILDVNAAAAANDRSSSTANTITGLNALSLEDGSSAPGTVMEFQYADSITSDDDDGVPIFTPAASVLSVPLAKGPSSLSTASSAATEQQPWVCTVPDCQKTFKQRHSLAEHLKSPAHAPRLYHCPTGIGLPPSGHTIKSFKTMSGILQHLEAGACVGGRKVLDHIFAMVEAKITSVSGTNVRLLRNGRS